MQQKAVIQFLHFQIILQGMVRPNQVVPQVQFQFLDRQFTLQAKVICVEMAKIYS